jgi:signal transduction histidine kinase
LLGLKQRVAVYGGQLDARRRLGGGFRVRAKLPLERP